MSPNSQTTKPLEQVPFPAEEIAESYLKFKYENARHFKHLGVKRSYGETSYAANIEKRQCNRFASQQDNKLRTNVMFIAYKMKNVKNTVIHFTRFGLLGWDTKDHITSKKHDRLMAVLLIEEIFKFGSEALPKVEKALTESDNEHVWKLLKPDVIAEAVEPIPSSSYNYNTHVSATTPSTALPTPTPSPISAAPNNTATASSVYATAVASSFDSTFVGVAQSWSATNGDGPSHLHKAVPEVVDLSSPVPSPQPNNNYWTCASCDSPNSETYPSCLVCAVPRRGVIVTAAVSHEWTCTVCTLKNVDNLQYCGGCYAPRYHNRSTTAPQTTEAEREVEWDCSACTFKNPLNVAVCIVCTAARLI